MIHAIVAAAMSAHMLVPAPTPLAARVVEHPAAQTQSGGAASGPPPAAAQLNFEVYRTQVEPLFLVKREGSARCVECHAPGAGTLRLQVLAPGTYTFKIKATNSSGVWSGKETQLKIVVLPPWWKSWWAYTLYALCLIAIAALIVRNYHNRVQEKAARNMELLEIAKEKELYHIPKC